MASCLSKCATDCLRSAYNRVNAAQELWVEDKLNDACGYLEHMLQQPKSKASVEYTNSLQWHYRVCLTSCHKAIDACCCIYVPREWPSRPQAQADLSLDRCLRFIALGIFRVVGESILCNAG